MYIKSGKSFVDGAVDGEDYCGARDAPEQGRAVADVELSEAAVSDRGVLSTTIDKALSFFIFYFIPWNLRCLAT